MRIQGKQCHKLTLVQLFIVIFFSSFGFVVLLAFFYIQLRKESFNFSFEFV